MSEKTTLPILKEIMEEAEKILNVREEEGFNEALRLWKLLDDKTAILRIRMPSEVFDLIMQLEFLFEDDPMADVSEARHALYLTKAYIYQKDANNRGSPD